MTSARTQAVSYVFSQTRAGTAMVSPVQDAVQLPTPNAQRPTSKQAAARELEVADRELTGTYSSSSGSPPALHVELRQRVSQRRVHRRHFFIGELVLQACRRTLARLFRLRFVD